MRIVLLLILAMLSVTWGSFSIGRVKHEIIMGLSTGYPPYYYKQNGSFTGACVELVEQVAGTLDLDIKFREYPWKRLLTSAEQGEIDAIMPLYRTKEREKFLHFDNLGIAKETNFFFVHKEREISFDGTFESVHGYSVGIISDYSYGEKFDSYTGFEKVVTLNEEHLIQMFQHQRFDIGVGNKSVIIYHAQKQEFADNIKFLSPHITDDLLYLGFSKNRANGELHAKFATALQKFKKTKAYRDILTKYNL